MSVKKFWIPVSVCVIVFCVLGFALLRSGVPRESIRIYKAVEPKVQKSATATPEVGDTSESGHLHGDQWHSELHDTTVLPDNEASWGNTQAKTPQEPSAGETTGVERQLTPIEAALLERGIDINQLPRNSNGELLRGSTGGIALVPNPRAPTQEDIERFEKKRRLMEIKSELLTFPSDGTLDKGQYFDVLDLQEEKLSIERELGIQMHGPDPLIGIKIARLAMSVITDEGIPVESAPRFIELYEELGDLHLANLFREAAQHAMQNGEEFFNFSLETHRGENNVR